MSDLQNEIKELKEFIVDLKADRAAQKEKERKDGWTKYTSLTLVFIAVLAAIASQWAGKYGSRVLVRLNDATYNQTQASDEWAYYQAKSIKQNLYEVAKDQIANGTADASKSEEKIKAKIEKYEKEKADISQKAKSFEKLREEDRAAAAEANRKGGVMGQAVAVFQIAIALSSVCLLTKRKPLWFVSILMALAATVEMVRAWLM